MYGLGREVRALSLNAAALVFNRDLGPRYLRV